MVPEDLDALPVSQREDTSELHVGVRSTVSPAPEIPDHHAVRRGDEVRDRLESVTFPSFAKLLDRRAPPPGPRKDRVPAIL